MGANHRPLSAASARQILGLGWGFLEALSLGCPRGASFMGLVLVALRRLR
jgi:hypothetical protein